MPDQCESAEEKAKRLAKEISKVRAEIIAERDWLDAAHEEALKKELEELSALKNGLRQGIEDLERSIEAFEKDKAELTRIHQLPEFQAYLKAKRNPRGEPRRIANRRNKEPYSSRSPTD